MQHRPRDRKRYRCIIAMLAAFVFCSSTTFAESSWDLAGYLNENAESTVDAINSAVTDLTGLDADQWRLDIFVGSGWDTNVIAVPDGFTLPGTRSKGSAFLETGFAFEYDIITKEAYTLTGGVRIDGELLRRNCPAGTPPRA